MPPRVQLATLLLGPFLLLGGSVGVQEAVAPPRQPVYAEHPPLGHTGGFGEPTCHACHFGGEVNGGDGTLAVDAAVNPRSVPDPMPTEATEPDTPKEADG